MEAPDILTATRKLEKSGMTRSQSEAIAETIVAAVAPLATREDLEGHRRATKADMAALRKDTKAGLESLKAQMATKTDIEALNVKFENVNTRIESMKVWLLSTLLGLTGALLAVAASIAVYSFRIGVGG